MPSELDIRIRWRRRIQRFLECCARHVDASRDESDLVAALEQLQRFLPRMAEHHQLRSLIKQWAKRQPLYWEMEPAARRRVDQAISDLKAA